MLTSILVALLLDEPAVIDRDNVSIASSTQVSVRAEPIIDADGDGVIHIAADNVAVDFAGQTLHGAPTSATPDTFAGVGVRITGKSVTIRNARIRGYKCAIYASGADGLTLENCQLGGNFAQRLYSTPKAEDGRDWLWPHRNDENEWLKSYGAAVYVEDSRNVLIRNCSARNGQNGILLDRVVDSRIYDNDFSFLSGWGIALWRCERNVISRNALDFCIRGYSHGVYNRGQDSTGILLFEQNLDNAILENSATHSGDGLFGFGGREALGEVWIERERERLRKETGKDDVEDLIQPSQELLQTYKRRGNRGNKIIGNDFSYAAAHGIELTFSFDNLISANRLVGNAISGIWGGYSQGTLICQNVIEENGDAGYGLDRGGINIEHGRDNLILDNKFARNRVGVHLWWDEDAGLLRTPWVRANDPLCAGNFIAGNTFDGDQLALHLRECRNTRFVGNTVRNVATELDAAPGSEPDRSDLEGFHVNCSADIKPLGEHKPVGARERLRGRDKIIVTDWGPYDWVSPLLHFVGVQDGVHQWRLLGRQPVQSITADGDVELKTETAAGEPRITVGPGKRGVVTPYVLHASVGGRSLTERAVLVSATWDIRVFATSADPRQEIETYRRDAGRATRFTMSGALHLPFAGGGASDLPDVPAEVKAAKLPRDRFGTIASTSLDFPAGKWRLTLTSDDGVRLLVDGKPLIDDWTWHAPKTESRALSLDAPTRVQIVVEHFELDGYAMLSLEITPETPGG